MTLANQKLLYEHLKSIGRLEDAENAMKAYKDKVVVEPIETSGAIEIDKPKKRGKK